MAEDEETVEYAESDGGNREEIHRSNGLTVIAEKRQPTFAEFWVSRCAPHPAGDGSFGNVKAEHEEATMKARSTPDRVLRNHLEDQLADLFGNPFFRRQLAFALCKA